MCIRVVASVEVRISSGCEGVVRMSGRCNGITKARSKTFDWQTMR